MYLNFALNALYSYSTHKFHFESVPNCQNCRLNYVSCRLSVSIESFVPDIPLTSGSQGFFRMRKDKFQPGNNHLTHLKYIWNQASWKSLPKTKSLSNFHRAQCLCMLQPTRELGRTACSLGSLCIPAPWKPQTLLLSPAELGSQAALPGSLQWAEERWGFPDAAPCWPAVARLLQSYTEAQLQHKQATGISRSAFTQAQNQSRPQV